MNRTQLYILIDDQNGFRVLFVLKITNLVLKHKKTPNFHLEFLVTPTGQISNHFMEDLKKLAYFQVNL